MSPRPVHLELVRALGRAERVLLTGPVPPDGDSLGACLALAKILSHHGIDARVAGVVPWRYAWMPGAEQILPDPAVEPDWPAVVVLDGDRHRLSAPVTAAFEAAAQTALIDHHASTRPEGYDLAWLEPGAESTCGMLFRALPDWGVPLDEALATLLYTGLAFDTGGFRYANTDPHTHQIAAQLLSVGVPHAQICATILAERRPAELEATGWILSRVRYALGGGLCLGHAPLDLSERHALAPGDLQGVVELLVHQVGVEVAALLIERAPGEVKVSLRSRGQVDVSRIAQRLSATGGGHTRAAGAVLRTPPDQIVEQIVALVTEQSLRVRLP